MIVGYTYDEKPVTAGDLHAQGAMTALLTDAIRAGILEDMGYAVDLIEFVDLAHSPKNLMIRAEKKSAPRGKNIPRFRELAERYGFRQKLLELCDRKE